MIKKTQLIQAFCAFIASVPAKLRVAAIVAFMSVLSALGTPAKADVPAELITAVTAGYTALGTAAGTIGGGLIAVALVVGAILFIKKFATKH